MLILHNPIMASQKARYFNLLKRKNTKQTHTIQKLNGRRLNIGQMDRRSNT